MPGPGRDDAAGGSEREVLRSSDEQPVGWGDERDEASDADDVARLLADRPPHHDSD